MLDLHDFLALPLTPCIRLRVNPDTEVEFDQKAVESRRDELIAFCRAIPGVNNGITWRQMKPWTGNNGMLAKALVALGEHLGVWQMYPRLDHELIWTSSKEYPSILVNSVTPAQEVPQVPKPSAGDLEKTLKECRCCGESMGPPGSMYYDILESAEEEGLCSACEEADCNPPSPCKQGTKKKEEKPPKKKVEEEEFNLADLDERAVARFVHNVNRR